MMVDWSAFLRDLFLISVGALLTVLGSLVIEWRHGRRAERQHRHERLEQRLEPIEQYVDNLTAASLVLLDRHIQEDPEVPLHIPSSGKAFRAALDRAQELYPAALSAASLGESEALRQRFRELTRAELELVDEMERTELIGAQVAEKREALAAAAREVQRCIDALLEEDVRLPSWWVQIKRRLRRG